MSDEANTDNRGFLVVFGGCLVTMAVTVLIIALAALVFIDTTNCGAVSRGLVVLFGTIALVFIISGLVVWNRARKFIADKARRVSIVILYAVVMLAIYILVAFGLMIAFNC